MQGSSDWENLSERCFHIIYINYYKIYAFLYVVVLGRKGSHDFVHLSEGDVQGFVHVRGGVRKISNLMAGLLDIVP